MVEGVPSGHQDGGENRIDIVQDVVGGEPDYVEAASAETGIASFVALGVRAHVVRRAVDLDDERGFMAEEVDDIRVDRVLLAKFEARGAGAELLPEDNLREGHGAAKLPGFVYGLPAERWRAGAGAL